MTTYNYRLVTERGGYNFSGTSDIGVLRLVEVTTSAPWSLNRINGEGKRAWIAGKDNNDSPVRVGESFEKYRH